MAPTARQTVTRFVATLAAVLVTLGFLVACAGNTSSSTQTSAAASASASQAPASSSTNSNPPAVTALASSPGGEIRPGCGTYCQSAGQYGAPGEHGVYAVTIVSSGTVTADPDGFVPVTVTCNLPVQCTGAIQICIDDGETAGMAMRCGRTDEVLEADTTQTVGIPMPTPALAFLRSNGATSAGMTVDNSNVPDCQQIPQLAAQCAKTVQALPATTPAATASSG